MKQTTASAILFTAALFLASPARAFEVDATALADTRAYFGRLEKLGFAGSLILGLGGETLLAAGYGLADREQGTPWTPETVSTVGSITKQFTGAAVLKLQEDGRLDVHDTIGKYFADVPPDKQGITLHQLLTHSSGISDLEGADDWDPIGRDEFIRRALAQPLAFPPGEGYEYSNAGYSLLGAIIEQLTGGSYEQFVRERLFLPAGMHDTGYILAGWDPARVAKGYDGDTLWGTILGRPIAEDGPYWALRANGGIHSTARDMFRWAEALRGGRVLSPTSLEQLWSPFVDEGVGSFYGYGWSIQDRGGMKVVTHNGGNGIYFADFAILPEAQLVVFVQTNVVKAFPGAGQLLENIENRLLASEPYPEVPDRVDAVPQDLAGVAGEYVLAGGGKVIVRPGPDDLAVEATGWDAFALLHSTKPQDAARTTRFSRRLDVIAAAAVRGDFAPLAEAYEGRVTAQRLAERWQEAIRGEGQGLGSSAGYEVLGTALTQERDVTLVRYEFEHGHIDRAYVWDPDQEEHLLGVSQRGLDPVLHFVPVRGGGYASWDGGVRPSVPLEFDRGSDGGLRLVIAHGEPAARSAGR